MTTDRMTTYYILAQIRNVYLDLHRGTDSAPTRFSASTDDVDRIFWRPSSYPTCNVPGHHPDTSPIHDSASPTFPPAVLHDNAAPISAPPAHTPHAPSSFVHAPPYVDENLVDVPLLNNTISVSTSFYPAHQTAMESPRSPGTSPDPVVARTTQDIEIIPRTTHFLIPDLSVYTPPPSSMTSTSPPDAATFDEHTADNNAPLDDLEV